MSNNLKWFVVLGVAVLALGLLFGTAMADPGDGADDGEGQWHMHERMDPELYGQMIQRMTEIHGAEFTAEMLQRMNEGGDCHEDGRGMMGAGMMGQGFDGTVGGFMHGVRGMVGGFNNGGRMNGGYSNYHGMMNGGYSNGGGMMNEGMMGR